MSGLAEIGVTNLANRLLGHAEIESPSVDGPLPIARTRRFVRATGGRLVVRLAGVRARDCGHGRVVRRQNPRLSGAECGDADRCNRCTDYQDLLHDNFSC